MDIITQSPDYINNLMFPIIVTLITSLIVFISSRIYIYFNSKKIRLKYKNHKYNFGNASDNLVFKHIPLENNPNRIFLSLELKIFNPISDTIILKDIYLYFNNKKKILFYFMCILGNIKQKKIKTIIIEPDIDENDFTLEFISIENFPFSILSKSKKLYLSYKDINDKTHYVTIKSIPKKFTFFNGLEYKEDMKLSY